MKELLKKYKKKNYLKNKVVSNLMVNGKKATGEKILLKFAKLSQKSNKNQTEKMLQLAIINAISIFSINTSTVKRGKRKTTKIVPAFLKNNSARINNSLNLLRDSISKNKKSTSFYKMMYQEFLNSAQKSGLTIDKKTELQNQVLRTKRYWFRFKW